MAGKFKLTKEQKTRLANFEFFLKKAKRTGLWNPPKYLDNEKKWPHEPQNWRSEIADSTGRYIVLSGRNFKKPYSLEHGIFCDNLNQVNAILRFNPDLYQMVLDLDAFQKETALILKEKCRKGPDANWPDYSWP